MHSTVLVRIPASVHANYDSIEAAVQVVMAPFQEEGAMSADARALAPFMEFEPIDPRELAHHYIEGGEEVDEKSIRHDGYHYSPKAGAWGRMTNKLSQWDWYAIGGRWRAQLPAMTGLGFRGHLSQYDRPEEWPDWIKERWGDPRLVDALRICDIDRTLEREITDDALTQAWASWEKFRPLLINHVQSASDVFDMRGTAAHYGLVQYRDAEEPITEAERAFFAVVPRDRGGGYELVWPEEDEATFRGRCAPLASPLRAANTLDAGLLPDRAAAWTDVEWVPFVHDLADAKRQAEWLRGGNQGDWIVLVDKHV